MVRMVVGFGVGFSDFGILRSESSSRREGQGIHSQHLLDACGRLGDNSGVRLWPGFSRFMVDMMVGFCRLGPRRDCSSSVSATPTRKPSLAIHRAHSCWCEALFKQYCSPAGGTPGQMVGPKFGARRGGYSRSSLAVAYRSGSASVKTRL